MPAHRRPLFKWQNADRSNFSLSVWSQSVTKYSFNIYLSSLQGRLEQKQRDEEDKLYRKFLERRREEEANVAQMQEEEREVSC